MINYIGFCGKAGVGKTTACKILKEFHIEKARKEFHIKKLFDEALILPWAFELKRIATECFGWDGKKDEKGRKLLQTLGTECGRMYGGDLFWVNRWQKGIDEYIESQVNRGNILILNDDTRFDSEANRIKENGGLMIKLVGRNLDLGQNSGHSSEAGIDNKYIDLVIDNSGTMEELKAQMLNLQNWRAEE